MNTTNKIIKNHSFPSQEDLKQMREKKGIVNLVLPENAPLSEKFKYEICQNILAYQLENKLTYEEISHKIGLPLSQTLEMLRGNTSAFALDSLVAYTDKLHLPLQVKMVRD
jgi:predicted XRE-type DNA-binding protein